MFGVDCIIVTYNPDPGLLAKVLATLAPQVRVCYIINNGAPSFGAAAGNARVVNLGANYGIAYAQNRGIEMALADNAEFVLLSDQDTLYPEDFVARLLSAYAEYHATEHVGRSCRGFIIETKGGKQKSRWKNSGILSRKKIRFTMLPTRFRRAP